MNCKLTNFSGDKSFGHLDGKEVREVFIFHNEYSDSITLKVILNNGSEFSISSDGKADFLEWDGENLAATHHNLDKHLLAKMVVQLQF